MKLAVALGSAAVLLPGTTHASWFRRDDALVSRGQAGCAFDITSSGSFACPAGELSDGQIRLNGTEDTATFYIDAKGGITDAKGFGCIVTDPPTTQIQCDQGAAPAPGFSIDSSDNILYKGSATFFACPATDTEYNIYVDPNFGQTKCFPIALKASGCGATSSSTCPPTAPPSTVWETQTITENTTQTVTVTTTSAELCTTSSRSPIWTPSSVWSNSTTICHHCTET